jgi:2-keto-3-deoxy-L-rhamnonate aldolase RhmA
VMDKPNLTDVAKVRELVRYFHYAPIKSRSFMAVMNRYLKLRKAKKDYLRVINLTNTKNK